MAWTSAAERKQKLHRPSSRKYGLTRQRSPKTRRVALQKRSDSSLPVLVDLTVTSFSFRYFYHFSSLAFTGSVDFSTPCVDNRSRFLLTLCIGTHWCYRSQRVRRSHAITDISTYPSQNKAELVRIGRQMSQILPFISNVISKNLRHFKKKLGLILKRFSFNLISLNMLLYYWYYVR